MDRMRKVLLCQIISTICFELEIIDLSLLVRGYPGAPSEDGDKEDFRYSLSSMLFFKVHKEHVLFFHDMIGSRIQNPSTTN